MKICNLALILILILASTTVSADGGFFPPVYYHEDLFEPEQKAIIVDRGGTEELIIQVTYKGDVADFAWVTPVPSYPEVEKSDSKLFTELHYLTEPEYRRPPNWSPLGIFNMGSASMSEGVNLHERKQVGLYDVSILSSDDPKALVSWLNDNNYSVSPKAEEVIGYYVDKNWFFIASRVNIEPEAVKLMESLKQIDSSINSADDARRVLVDNLVHAIMENMSFQDPIISKYGSVKLDYGEVEENAYGPPGYYYPRYPSTRRDYIINEYEYYDLYEAYNGYLYRPSKGYSTVTDRSIVYQKILQEIANALDYKYLPKYPLYTKNYCVDKPGERYCGHYFYTLEDKAYQMLEGVDCGEYCGRLSPKKFYPQDDIATVSAYAILNGNMDMAKYYKVDPSNYEGYWYESQSEKNRKFSYLVNSIKSSMLSYKISETEELMRKDIAGIDGVSPAEVGDVKKYLAERTLEDFREDVGYDGSLLYMLYGGSIISSKEYQIMHSIYVGDRDEYSLRDNITALVDQVLDWQSSAAVKSLNEGSIHPLSISFKTDDFVYPLKISSVNSGVTDILIYVFAKHKMDAEGFGREYAKWIEVEDIEPKSGYYEKYPTLNKLLDDRYYLTKFRRTMWPKEMTDDVIFKQAGNDRSEGLVVYSHDYASGWVWFIILNMVLVCLLWLYLTLPALLVNRFAEKTGRLWLKASGKRLLAYSVAPALLMVLGSGLATFSDYLGIILLPLMVLYLPFIVLQGVPYSLRFMCPEWMLAILISFVNIAFWFLLVHWMISALFVRRRFKKE
ncbi:MAG: DUF2330 domain-containing protein [Candidatus Altiarchaeota archaeon]